jgi:putative heme-binding domain-containing protein
MRQLLHYRLADLRNKARKLLHQELPQECKQVLQQYRAALSRKGDPHRGREVFKKNCATCHHVAGVGTTVGPDISDTRTKTAEQLLSDIINPNATLNGNYVNYMVTTKDGKVLTGMLAAETASSLTLRRAENQTDVILRRDVEQIQSTGQSLMPEGLEKNISVEQMADLLSFLKNWRYLDGLVPLGEAAPAKAR